jgi:hypothetical protein
MDSLAAEGELKYAAATDDIERAWAVASTALAGCFLIADALDALTERIAGLDNQPGADSGNVGAELANLSGKMKKRTKAMKKWGK